MIPYLDNIPSKRDTSFTPTDGVIIITLQMGLTRAEDKAQACEFIHPYGHRFIQE